MTTLSDTSALIMTVCGTTYPAPGKYREILEYCERLLANRLDDIAPQRGNTRGELLAKARAKIEGPPYEDGAKYYDLAGVPSAEYHEQALWILRDATRGHESDHVVAALHHMS